MSSQSARRAAEKVSEILRQNGFQALLAGGCVRDLLLEVEPKDYDVATNATPDQVVSLFHRTEKVGAQFGVVLVRIKGCMIEVATFRSDGDYSDGRHPDSIRFVSAEEDARRRDFTINGMFFDPQSGRIIDYVGGQADLRAKLVRAIGEPARRFAEDHLRMLRAVRFAAGLSFEIEPETLDAIRFHAARIRAISVERIQQELARILTSPTRRRGWELLADSGLLAQVLPETAWSAADVADVAERLGYLPPEADFMLATAVALGRFAPQPAGRICRRLRCSNEQERGVVWLIENLPRVLEADRLELADVKFLLADSRFERLGCLLEAECRGRFDTVLPHDTLLSRASRIPPEQVAPPPLVGGEDLQTLHLPAGPIYKQILDAVYRAQLNEELPDREAALRLVHHLLEHTGRMENGKWKMENGKC
ncbi:MAG: CCA tRNA nucleotidyltransferase [Phycisphaerae bacterium]|nr:CCA tRNA nucleotidyltransferase [Phycisphaerae bacterium]